jgi:hypothetical protein
MNKAMFVYMRYPHFLALFVIISVIGLFSSFCVPVARPLPAHTTSRTETSMPQVGFEPTIPVFERAKTVHALDRAATGIRHC